MVRSKVRRAIYKPKEVMIDLELNELLSLYFYLSEKDKLPLEIESTVNKLEKKIFNLFNVKEIEEFRTSYNYKGKI